MRARLAGPGLAAMILGGCVSPGGPAAVCDVTVKFGSYGAGIDRDLADRIVLAATRDHGVRRVERRPWGREGELDLCLTARSPALAAGVFERLRPLIPARGKVGPTSILGPNGAHIETAGPEPSAP